MVHGGGFSRMLAGVRAVRWFLCAPVVVASLAAAGCAPDKPINDAPLLVGRGADAIALDPARITDSESSEVTEQIFDHLVRYQPRLDRDRAGAGRVAGSVSADGRVWTFHLRQNVRFHDGTPFDADAVVFCFDRQRDPHHPYHQADFTYWENTFRNIQAVETLDAADGAHHHRAALRAVPRQPGDVPGVDRLADGGAQVGRRVRAPSRRHRAVPLRRVVAGRAHHARGQPELLGRRAQDPAPGLRRHPRSRASAWSRSRAAPSTSPRTCRRRICSSSRCIPSSSCMRVAGNNVGYLAMNTQHPPFDDVRVRRAVNYAINKTAIVKLIYQGLARPATVAGAAVDVGPRRRGALQLRPRDGDAAARRGALRPPGASGPSSTSWTRRARYMPAPETVARIIQHNLRDVGMDVEVVVNDFDTHVRLTQNGEHDLCLLGWSADNGDPDNFLYVLFDPENAEPGIGAQRRLLQERRAARPPHLGAGVDRSRRARALLQQGAGPDRARGAVGAAGARRGGGGGAHQRCRRCVVHPSAQRSTSSPGVRARMSALGHDAAAARHRSRARAARWAASATCACATSWRSCSPSRRCLPVLGASTVAMRLVLAGLQVGRARADRAHHARRAQPGARRTSRRCSKSTIRLSEPAGLSRSAAARSGSRPASCWRGTRTQLCRAWSRSPTRSGKVVGAARRRRPRELEADLTSTEAIRRALGYERRVTIARGRRRARRW